MGGSGGVSIAKAVEKLDASLVSTRSEGLEELRLLLGHGSHTSQLHALDDDAWHQIFESIFRLVKAGKAPYIRAKSATSKAAAAGRLEAASGALRLVVDFIGPSLRFKTANAVLDHIVDILPSSDEGLCAPVENDYIKVFKTISEYSAHGEHFKAKQWQTYIDFAISIVEIKLEWQAGSESDISRSRHTATSSRNELGVTIRTSQTSNGISPRASSSVQLDELLGAIRNLTSITNAPLKTRLGQVANVLINCVERLSRGHELAFEALNNLLPYTLTEDLNLANYLCNAICGPIRSLWETKSAILKEQMLITLYYLRHIYSNSARHPDIGLDADVLDGLISTLWQDLERRTERDLLQIDDISFQNDEPAYPLAIKDILPAADTTRVATAWSTLLVLAHLILALDDMRQQEQDTTANAPQKRRRLRNSPEDVLLHASRSHGQNRIVALQIAIFVTTASPEISTGLRDRIVQLEALSSDEDPAVSPWLFLLLSRLAMRSTANDPSLGGFWQRTWALAARACSTVACCRPACYLLSCILRFGQVSSITSDQNLLSSIFADGSSGPGVFSDTAIEFLVTALSSGRLSSETTFKAFAGRCLSWLDLQWTIPHVPDRLHNAAVASHGQSRRIYSLLQTLQGHATCLKEPPIHVPVGPLFNAAQIDIRDLDFTRYALAMELPAECSAREASFSMTSGPFLAKQAYLSVGTVIDFLGAKVRSFHLAWKALSSERSSNISIDIAEISATACIVLRTILRCSATNISNIQQFEAQMSGLWEDICSFCRQRSGEQMQISISRLAQAFLQIKSKTASKNHLFSIYRKDLVVTLLTMYDQASYVHDNLQVSDFDLMESLQTRTSQSSQTKTSHPDPHFARQDLPVPDVPASLFAKCFFDLKCDLICAEFGGFHEPEAISRLIEEVLLMTDEQLLLGRFLLIETLEQQDIVVNRSNANRLLERLAKLCLQNDDLERCEAALAFCLRIMTIFAPMWIATEDDDLSNNAYDMCSWFITVALNKGIGSDRVLLQISRMLEHILYQDSTYRADNLPSPRTSLLQILHLGRMSTSYVLADRLSCLFEGYVLSEHPAVFTDVVENLPADPDSREEIAVRLFILAKLGNRWHTILRQAVYHIFETAANVPTATGLARACVRAMCCGLQLENARVLFNIFSPQVLYTWLEQEEITKIPFGTFDFQSLKDCIADVQEEIVAQSVMRSSTPLLDAVANELESQPSILIERSFAKAAAYAVIADVGLGRSSREGEKSETFLLRYLGEEKMISLLRNCLPQIVAIVILRLADDRGFEKSLTDPKYGEILMIYTKICEWSSSKLLLPTSQQPSFRAKYLMSILKRLCLLTEIQPESLWSSDVLISIFRALLDDAKAAFGTLHACNILRKTRLLLSLAGTVPLSGYTLKMLLNALRPYLTQFHCSEDAIGIYWYLLDQGKSYLETNPCFVTGLTVSLISALSMFGASSQESNTPEAHFKSTMSHAQEFRNWLGDYFDSLKFLNLASEVKNRLSKFVYLAKMGGPKAGSTKSSSEGLLIYQLIDDQANEEPLIPTVFFRSTLRTLCSRFDIAPDVREDILSDSRVELTPVLWSIMRDLHIPHSFRRWAAEAAGRLYGQEGPDALENFIAKKELNLTRVRNNKVLLHSFNHIVDALKERLWDDDRSCVSSAEQVLQEIFSSVSSEDRFEVFGSEFDDDLYKDLRFQDFQCPPARNSAGTRTSPHNLTAPEPSESTESWASGIAVRLCAGNTSNPILASLIPALDTIPNLATHILKAVVHIALLKDAETGSTLKDALSDVFMQVLAQKDHFSEDASKLVLDIVMYLRSCTLSSESTMAQRFNWLKIDPVIAATAASRCGLYQHALLLIELYVSQETVASGRLGNRSSLEAKPIPDQLQSMIYCNVDDPDFFYGKSFDANMQSIFQKLSHEKSGPKALSFQSAMFDSSVKATGMTAALNESGSETIDALSLANLQGLADVMTSFSGTASSGPVSRDRAKHSANLEEWDNVERDTPFICANIVNQVFSVLKSSANKMPVLQAIDHGAHQLLDQFTNNEARSAEKLDICRSLSILAESRRIFTVPKSSLLDIETVIPPNGLAWYDKTGFSIVEPLLVARESIFCGIKENSILADSIGLTQVEALHLELCAVRSSLKIAQSHSVSQFCLNRAAYLSDLQKKASEIGLNADAAVQYDLANTFWAHDESSAAITILQKLSARTDLDGQVIQISLPEILTDLGQKLTEARLERPDEVTLRYLRPAIQALDGSSGRQAGKVFHTFAAFCDRQIRDPSNIDEYRRIETLRNRKKQEVEELDALKRSKQGKERDQIRSHLAKAQTWFRLDEEEWKRIKIHSEDLVRNCLENFLLAMRACDDFPNDVIRFLALWLEQADNAEANATVGKYLPHVPSYKFAPLMNQLSSRILDNKASFQLLLHDLMFRICNDHPFHSLYQIFATSKSKGQKNDSVATSRYTAASKLAERVMKHGSSSATWIAIHNSNIAFVRLAQEKIPENAKTGSKLQLRKLQMGAKLEQTFQDLNTKIPPPTMSIQLRRDAKYASIPALTRFDSYISIAGGVSAPKIVTTYTSNGSKHKMLLKGGNDDLRQDSIMEQVFGQVSNLLKDHRATRQRNLGIRTYKVIPLTHNAGIIEFVMNTIPLHDYVLPAHVRYYPKDYKPGHCRKAILDAQSKSVSQRLQAYRTITERFHPVLRFFFMEHFLDPDDWFQKRLNYSRSTAAISILGYALGLGDRHGHNILLDTNSGEVVHIDLGVAFEAGRVLPVPEVVPFRLTRDLVDGMGLTGVEGVFRRCCNFTLEALRQDQEAIMTILDVLRWDPLYSWSISPLRLQRMQKNQEQAPDAGIVASSVGETTDHQGTSVAPDGGGGGGGEDTKNSNEPGEADRALAVVARKLGKSLSVEATVNDLIRQATDERNLAVLYCGWAAYA